MARNTIDSYVLTLLLPISGTAKCTRALTILNLKFGLKKI